MHVTEEDVFAWRTLFEAALHALEFSLSSGLARGVRREGEEHLVHSCTGSATRSPSPLLSSPLLSSPLSTILPSLSPSLEGVFTETSQLLITAGDSERGCGF